MAVPPNLISAATGPRKARASTQAASSVAEEDVHGLERGLACANPAAGWRLLGDTGERIFEPETGLDGPEAVVSDEFEALYESTYTAVVRFLYRKVWDAERAEDLAQEVFVRALAHRPEKPRAWVFAVAANLARDEARAAVRRKRHLTLLKGDPVAQPAFEPSAEDRVERDEEIAAVQDALAVLTPRDREILLLWDAGLSYPEIAAQTGLALGAVGTTLARARKRMVAAHERQQMGDHAAHS
jgi:RNA polymerase sigma factor (sigma-70 family)